jgi:3-methyladenine DNA glycosylase AlkD
MHPYILPIIKAFESVPDPSRAEQMKRYMKDRFDFYGIPTAVRRTILSEHIRNYSLPEWTGIHTIVRELWELDQREYQMLAIDLLNRMKKKLEPGDLPLLEYLITHKSWWDSVDGIAGWLAGELFRRHPELIKETTGKWMDSGNIWLQRSCLLFQLKYKKDTDLDLLFGFIEALADHKSFWIRKAIGWILREYSKTDPETVARYVSEHPELSGLSKREALKRIQRK